MITNSDDRTADILTSLGVRVNPLHYGDKPQPTHRNADSESQYDIDFTVLSYDVGVEKPDSRIFAAAEETLQSLLHAGKQRFEADEWSKVYVGDEHAKDVVGATQAGWRAVLVDRETPGKQEGVEWLHEDRVQGGGSAVLERPDAKAVGFSSLSQLGEWLPKRGQE